MVLIAHTGFCFVQKENILQFLTMSMVGADYGLIAAFGIGP